MRIKERIENCKRVIAMTKKPDLKEFFSVSRICAIGIILLGLIGFLIFLITNIKEFI